MQKNTGKEGRIHAFHLECTKPRDVKTQKLVEAHNWFVFLQEYLRGEKNRASTSIEQKQPWQREPERAGEMRKIISLTKLH
jgi:hypothetical protein